MDQIGGIGTALQDFTGDGKIWLEGEAWAVRSNVAIAKDQEVIVTDLVGLVLEIEPVPESNISDGQLQT